MIINMSRSLEQKMAAAESYDDWKQAAIACDQHNGHNKWKQRARSSKYDFRAIQERVEKLKRLREERDNHGLLFTLNEGIHGNLGGMGKASLYQKARFGTKNLIEDYTEEVVSALDYLAQPQLRSISFKEKLDFFQRAHLCYGRSALLMSGAGTFLFFHIGVVKALWEQNLIPEVLSGASGGALVAAIVGTRSHEDLGEAFTAEFLDFEADMKNVIANISLLGKRSMRQADLERVVCKVLPDLTFSEAYEVSGVHINVSIAPAKAHQKSRLLNAITTPNVMVREAVVASCSIPGIFPAVRLAAKDVDGNRVPYLPSRKWVDGSLSDELPMKRLSRLYGVNHFIVSQTNPLVLPFVSAEKNPNGLISTISETGMKTFKDWALAASHILQKPFKANSYISKLVNGYISVVSQTYTGDINILPSSRFLNLTKVLSARNMDEIDALVQDGERATWPQIEKIRIQTEISRHLSKILSLFKKRLINKGQQSDANDRAFELASKRK